MRRFHRKPPILPSLHPLTPHPPQRDERVLIVWSDNLDGIIPLCQDFEDKLIKLVWRSRPALPSTTTNSSFGTTPSVIGSGSDVDLTEKEKGHAGRRRKSSVSNSKPPPPPPKKKSSRFGWSWKLSSSSSEPAEKLEGDEEKGMTHPKDARPVRLFAPFYGGLGAALSLCEFSFPYM